MSTNALPLPTWKDMYDKTEAFWSKPINQMLGSDTYLGFAGLIREQALTRHEIGKEAAEAYWEALRLPTKTDHARLAGQVVALEAKVEGLSEQLDTVTSKLTFITDKLEAVLAAVEAAKPAVKKN